MSAPGPWHHMDDTVRRQWQNPEAILSEIGLKPGLTFVDVGCGRGFFTLPAARLVSAKGRVLGVDIDSDAVEELKRAAASEGLQNMELITGTAEDTLLCQSCADIVFLGIVLHDFRDPIRVLSNVRQMLKPEGRLVNLDWKKEPMRFGPPLSIRFDENTASDLIRSAGFKIESLSNSGLYHYIIVASP